MRRAFANAQRNSAISLSWRCSTAWLVKAAANTLYTKRRHMGSMDDVVTTCAWKFAAALAAAAAAAEAAAVLAEAAEVAAVVDEEEEEGDDSRAGEPGGRSAVETVEDDVEIEAAGNNSCWAPRAPPPAMWMRYGADCCFG
jgi:hypothetical protein